jgi:hypothetical protein
MFAEVPFLTRRNVLRGIQGPGFKPLKLPPRGRRTPDRFDILIGSTLCVSLIIIILYKYVTNTMEYMTQPCHLVSL